MHLERKACAGVVWAILFCLNLRLAGAADATADNTPAENFSPGPLFERGRFEMTLGGGALFSPIGSPKNRPTINYTMTELGVGYMLEGVKGDGWWRGNFELAGEGFGSAIFEGPGRYVAGMTVWLRYNFVPVTSRVVPYLQGGGGLASTDIDRGIVGQPFNFNLDAGVGVRYLISRHWSINLEYRYQHISNADLGKKNIGINAQGPILGVSCFF